MTSSDDQPAPSGPVWFDEPAPPRATEQLSRARIVTAAIDLADREVYGEITMRSLATRLGVRSPMALYRYVRNKDGLADLMVDEIYGRISAPTGEGWRACLRGLGRTGWDEVQRHPWFARLAFSRPPLGPHALTLYDAALAELEPHGLDAGARMGCINTVFGHVLGSGLALLEEQAMRSRVGLHSEDEMARAVAPYLARITSSGRYPHFARWADDPDRHQPGPLAFELVLDWLLDGLATIVAPA